MVEKDEEEKKKADRASRFGVDASAISGDALDSALPDRPRKRGRGGEESATAAGGDNNRDRGNKRQRGHRGFRGGQRGGGGGGGGGRQGGNGVRKSGQGGDRPRGVLQDPEERRKAEARKARFA